MADVVKTVELVKSNPKSFFVFNNRSDGTGENKALKIDISALPGAPTKIKINKIIWNIAGMSVDIYFDHTVDDMVLSLTGDGDLDMSGLGGLPDPASAGGTGDVLFSTVGHDAGDGYMIAMEVEVMP